MAALPTTCQDFLRETKPNIAILTPCYGAQVGLQYLVALMATIDLGKSVGVNVTPIFCGNDSLVTRARNNLVAKAMSQKENPFTHVLFIDADIGWDEKSVFLMVEANKDVLAGIYPLKTYDMKALIAQGDKLFGGGHWKEMMKTAVGAENVVNLSDETFVAAFMLRYNMNTWPTGDIPITDGKFAALRFLPTGFLMIKTKVFEEKLSPLLQNERYTDDTGFLSEAESAFAYPYFQTVVRYGRLLSEDWFFCELCRSAGVTPFGDIRVNLSHTGNHTFTGSLSLWIAARLSAQKSEA